MIFAPIDSNTVSGKNWEIRRSYDQITVFFDNRKGKLSLDKYIPKNRKFPDWPENDILIQTPKLHDCTLKPPVQDFVDGEFILTEYVLVVGSMRIEGNRVETRRFRLAFNTNDAPFLILETILMPSLLINQLPISLSGLVKRNADA